MKRSTLIFLGFLITTLIKAQCTAPSFNVNFSATEDTTWTLTSTTRAGVCCGSSNCVTFTVVLHPNTELISFDVTNPSPSGSAFYQINCGPPVSIGTPFCAVGLASPFTITYCKPGGDSPDYILSAGTIVHASDDISIRKTNCVDTLFVTNVETSSIQWTSIYPGAQGAYHSYLSCTAACNSTIVTPGVNPPPYIDFQVSGNPNTNCGSFSRDTVRVYFVTPLTGTVSPSNPVICGGSSTTVTLTALPAGGAAPYSYDWGPGPNTATYTASAAGTYTVTISDNTNCPDITLTKVIASSPSATFTYSEGSYCKNSPNVTPVFTGVGQAGVFSSSPAGLVFANTGTGEINFAASSSGTYTITNTIAPAGSCPGTSATFTLTIYPYPVMTSASAISVCSGSTVNINLTSSVNSTYSWIAADNVNVDGESLTAQTSSSLVNTLINNTGVAQIVTYTITPTSTATGGCSGQTQIVNVTVNPMDDAGFTYSSSTNCQTGSDPTTTISGLAGGTFSSTAGLVFTSTSTGTIDLSASALGSYTVTYSTNGVCPNSETFPITITTAPSAIFAYPGTPYCQDEANPSPVFGPGAGGGTFTSTAGLVFINAATGEVDLISSTPGTYTVTNTIPAAGGCAPAVATATIKITPVNVATFSYPGTPYCKNSANPLPVYSNGGVAGTFTSGAGLSINSLTGEIYLSSSTAGTYTVTNTIASNSGCPSVSATATVTITDMPVSAFSYTGTPYCQNGSDPSPVFTGGGSAGIFTASSVYVEINSSNGIVDLSNSPAGNYFITNSIAAADGCPSVSTTMPLTITSLPVASFSYSGTPYCQSGADPTPDLVANGTNGIYSASPSGLVIDANAGTVDLSASAPGSYTISNTVAAADGCPQVVETATLRITPLPVATFNYSALRYCQDGIDPYPTFIGNGVAGVFSASGGLSVDATNGQVNVSEAAVGTYTVTNTIAAANGCPDVIETAMIVIDAPAVADAGQDATICSGTSYTMTGNINGGASSLQWTSSGSGSFDNAGSASAVYTPSAADIAAGSVTITLTTNDPTGPCPAVSDAMVLSIDPAATVNAGNDATICALTSYTLSGSIGGGASSMSWTTSGTGSFDDVSSASAKYSPSAADIANGSVTLTLTTNDPAGPCGSVSDAMVLNITPRDNPSFSYGGSTFCQSGSNPVPVITGNAGGTFSASSSQLIIDPSTGTINAAGSMSGTYTVTYTTAGPCTESSTASVTITDAPSAAFSYSSPEYCTSGSDPNPIFTAGSSAGVFSSGSDLVIDPASGVIDLSASAPGTYSVNNYIAASGGCASAIAVTNITISPAAIANASTDAVICSGTTYTLSGSIGGGASSLTWNTSGNGSFDDNSSASTVYSPSASDISAGSVILTLTSNDPAGACPMVSDQMTLTIDPAATANAGADAVICSGTTYVLAGSFGGGATTMTWSSSGTGTFSDASSANAIYTPSASDIAAGSVILTLTSNDPAGPCGPVSDAMQLMIDPAAVVNAGSDATICAGASHTLSGGIAGGASSLLWSSSASGSFSSATSGITVYTPSSADIANGNVILTITSNDPAGPCGSVSDQMVLNILPRDNATFSYSGSLFCQSGADPAPVINGTQGGGFSSTSGLIIDPSNGAIDLSASTLGTYSIIYTTGGSCPQSSSVTLTITDAPSAQFAYAAPSYCHNAGDPLPMFLAGSTPGVFSASNGLVIDPNTGIVDLSASTPGTYTVTNTIVSAGGCAFTDASTSITINPLDNASFNYSAASYCMSATNQLPVITGTPGGSFSCTTAGLAMNANGEINVSASTPGTYAVYYTTTGICFNSDSTIVTINPLPVADAGGDRFIDCGANPISIEALGETGLNYTWNTIGGNFVDGNTSSNPVINQTGQYYVSVTNAFGCVSCDTINVNESSVLPDASFTASTGVLTGEAPFVLDLQNTSVNANTYSWYFGDGGANSSMVDPSVTYSNAGIYQIELIASNNGRCADTAHVTVVVEDPFSIPDGFSPTGDGVNDLFVIDGIDKYPENSFVVFNRWGNMVYEAKPYNNEWDGTSSKGLRLGGDKLPVGTYFYVLDLGDGSKVIKGNVYLKK